MIKSSFHGLDNSLIAKLKLSLKSPDVTREEAETYSKRVLNYHTALKILTVERVLVHGIDCQLVNFSFIDEENTVREEEFLVWRESTGNIYGEW